MIDDTRKDKCLSPEGKLFSGGFAMVKGTESTESTKLLGRVVFLSRIDQFGFWEGFDRLGDMVIIHPEELMPLSIEDLDNKTDLDTHLYEARYGL